MGTCKTLIAGTSKICGQQSSDYFWFHDSHELIDDVYPVCHNHSQSLLVDQMAKERQLKSLIEALTKRRENLYKQGRATVSTHNLNLKNEIRVLNEKISFQWDLLKTERNKTCRWCGFPLLEPNFDVDHIQGNPFSHADWHSQRGYRREVMMYHTLCGREFMSQKIRLTAKQLSFINPRDSGQTTMRDLIAE